MCLTKWAEAALRLIFDMELALPIIILQGTVDGSRHRGRLRKSWKDNVTKWTGQLMSSLLHIADDRSRWAAIIAEASVRLSNDGWASRELIGLFVRLPSTREGQNGVRDLEVKVQSSQNFNWPYFGHFSTQNRNVFWFWDWLQNLFKTCEKDNWLWPFDLEVWQNVKNTKLTYPSEFTRY